MFKPLVSTAQLAIMLEKVIKAFRLKSKKPTYSPAKLLWIKEVSAKIYNLLEQETKKYNEHSDDRLLARDIISAVQTVLNKLLKLIENHSNKV
jgi:hypothetical protein